MGSRNNVCGQAVPSVCTRYRLLEYRGIALLFHDRGTRRRVSGQQHARAALYPRGRLGIHCTGGWVGPRAGLHGRISSDLRDQNTGSHAK